MLEYDVRTVRYVRQSSAPVFTRLLSAVSEKSKILACAHRTLTDLAQKV